MATAAERRRPVTHINDESRESTLSRVDSRPSKSERQDLNLRPLGPEPAAGAVLTVGGSGKPWQPLDDTQVDATASVEGLPREPPNGRDGSASADQVAADLRRTEFLRPEHLLPVRAAAERLGVSVATVHASINAGELRWVLFGSVRRVRPEDLEAYVRARSASCPPADEDWCTVADLVRATGFSRSKAYRLLERGILPFKVFAGTRYIRSEAVGVPLQGNKRSGNSFMIPQRTGFCRTTGPARSDGHPRPGPETEADP
jgi:excisionase family DNA binding protein